MADSPNITPLPKIESREHPTDEIGLAIGQLESILDLISANYDGDAETGDFTSPPNTIYRANYACVRLAESIRDSLNRLTTEYEVPFHSKAYIAAKEAKS